MFGGVKPKTPPKKEPLHDIELIRKTLKILDFTTTYAQTLTTNIYLNKVFQLAKSWDVTHRV